MQSPPSITSSGLISYIIHFDVLQGNFSSSKQYSQSIQTKSLFLIISNFKRSSTNLFDIIFYLHYVKNYYKKFTQTT